MDRDLTPERWREMHLSRERGASWSAPVPWRFPLTNPYPQIRQYDRLTDRRPAAGDFDDADIRNGEDHFEFFGLSLSAV